MAAGVVLTVVASAAAGLSALSAPTPARGLAAALCLVVLAAGVRTWRQPAMPVQLRVTPQAEILARADADAEARPLQVRFVAPWLIVLADAHSTVAVWPDQLGADEFRRLTVACRWRRPAATA